MEEVTEKSIENKEKVDCTERSDVNNINNNDSNMDTEINLNQESYININTNNNNIDNDDLKVNQSEEIETKIPIEYIDIKLDYNSVVNLVITTIGSGCMALASKLQYISIIWYIVLLILCAYLNYFTSYILVKVATKNKIFNDSLLIEKVFSRNMSTFYFGILFISSMGVSVLYQLIGFFLI